MNTRAMGSSSRLARRLLVFVWAALLLGAAGAKAEPVKTVVQDRLYRADGSAAHGTVSIGWSGFSTGAGEAVVAGQMTVPTDPNGGFSISLIPNTGSAPSGSYYKVVIKLDDGTTSEEQWVVPATASTTVAAIRAKVVPQAIAAQFVSRDYVDSAVGTLTMNPAVHLSGAESIQGTKTFLNSPEVPVPSNAGEAANKGYVDQGIPAASSASPAMNGAVAVGSSVAFARADHVHPVDTSRAASNASTTVNGVNCGLGSPCTVVDATKATPQNVQQQSYSYAGDTGAANAYAVILNPTPSLIGGMPIVFKAANANTGASTLAVNGGTAIAIYKQGGGTALVSGDITAGQLVRVAYDGMNFQMQSQSANTGAGAGLPSGVTSNGTNGLNVAGNLAAGTTCPAWAPAGSVCSNGKVLTPVSLDGYASMGVVKKKLNALASNTIYSAGTVTYSAGTYTAANGVQPIPVALASGQVYFVSFPSVNPGAANLVVGSLPAKPIKVLDSSGTMLTLAGGEIVPGPASLYYNGTAYIYPYPGDRSVSVTTATTLTQANFASRDTFFLTSGAQTVTLPCSSTLSPNGQVAIFSYLGAITINVTGGCTPTDSVGKNGVAATSQSIAQGAALAIIATDGNGHFYVSGS